MKYKIYPQRNLLVDTMQGNIYLPALETIFLREISDPGFLSVHRVISDIRRARLMITLSELQGFINLMINPNPLTTFRWAILTDQPDQTAFSILIQQHPYFSNIVGVFSTLTACSHFVGTTYAESEFDDTDFIII